MLDLLTEAIELRGVRHQLMSDNGTPFVAIVRTTPSRFERTLAELSIRHIRYQVGTSWTSGKIKAFSATLQAEMLDRQQFTDLAAAEAAVKAYAATATTTASTANSPGTPRPSGSTHAVHRPGLRDTARGSPKLQTSETRSWRPEGVSHFHRGRSS